VGPTRKPAASRGDAEAAPDSRSQRSSESRGGKPEATAAASASGKGTPASRANVAYLRGSRVA
jgi:hypothetical protein